MHSDPISVERRAVWLVLTVLTVAWVLWAGKDLSWDIVNHHVYLPFSLFSGRFQHDLWAAGPQAYQNPVGYVPFYLLARSPLPSFGVAMALAATHALAALSLHRLTVVLFGASAQARPWRLLALAWAWVAPVFLWVVGTSHTDLLAVLLLLAALAITIQGGAPGHADAAPARHFRWGHFWWAGAALGAALAIKPVYLPFALCTGALFALRAALGQQPWRGLAFGTLGGAAALLLLYGPWAAWLWVHFGNPVYPFYNQFFGSPLAPAEAWGGWRFIPDTWAGYLSRPWELAELRMFTGTESFTPDLRPLVASVLLVLVLVLAAVVAVVTMVAMLLRARTSPQAPLAPQVPVAMAARLRQVMQRPDVQFTLFMLVSYVWWMRSSGNSRYGLMWMLLVGLWLVRLAFSLLPEGATRAAQALRALLLAGLLLQAGYFGTQGSHRMSSAPWTLGPYVQTEVHPRLQQEPFLHLSLSTLTLAAVAPDLHRGGRLVNLIGQFPLPPDGPLGERLQTLLHEWHGRTRLLVLTDADVTHPSGIDLRTLERIDEGLYRHQLRLVREDCLPLKLVGVGNGRDFNLRSCAAGPATRVPPPGWAALQAQVDAAYAVLEAQCPRLLSPRPFFTVGTFSDWWRGYANSESRITASLKEGMQLSHPRSMELGALGSIEDVAAGRGRNPCTVWREEMFQWKP
jgi:hypothetical protein